MKFYKVRQYKGRAFMTLPSWVLDSLDNPKSLSMSLAKDQYGIYLIVRGYPR